MHKELLKYVQTIKSETGQEIYAKKLHINGLYALFINGKPYVMSGDYDKDLAFLDGLYIGLTTKNKQNEKRTLNA